MPVDPRLGYDPSQNAPRWAGPQTREQWIADMATSLTLRYLNGADMTEPEMADTYFQQNGLPMPPKSSFGSAARNPNNAQDPMVYNSMLAVASKMFDSRGIGLPSGGTPLSENDQTRIYNSQENEKDRANSMAIAGMQESGANSRNAATNASNERIASLKAQVDRESIASNERVATADRASRENIANQDRAEKAREFDLGIAEDRRQFNSTMLFNLIDRGIQLMQKPVDWLGYQFYLQNMAIPLTSLNLSSVAVQLGAVPPSGPSAAGPVTGGPAVMDGDTSFAQQAGVQNPGFVSVQQAVQANPGTPTDPNLQTFTAMATYPQMVQQAGGAQQLEALVAQGRTTELPQVLGDNPVVQDAVVQSKQALAAVPPQTPMDRFTQPTPGMDSGGSATAIPTVPGAAPQPEPPQLAGALIGGSAFGGKMVGGPPPPANGSQMTAFQPPQPPAVVPFGNDNQMHAIPQVPGATVTQGGNTGGTSGVFTGPAQTGVATPTSNGGVQVTQTSNTGASNPQGNDLLGQLAAQLGVPVEQVRQLVPPNLLAGGYSVDTIMNTPVIKNLMNPNGPGFNFYRTNQDATKFNTIQAFGKPLGIRGGQDMNAGTFLQAPKSMQEMTQGTVEASGQYWPDVQEQMFRSSPLTNYEAGAFGKRRF